MPLTNHRAKTEVSWRLEKSLSSLLTKCHGSMNPLRANKANNLPLHIGCMPSFKCALRVGMAHNPFLEGFIFARFARGNCPCLWIFDLEFTLVKVNVANVLHLCCNCSPAELRIIISANGENSPLKFLRWLTGNCHMNTLLGAPNSDRH